MAEALISKQCAHDIVRRQLRTGRWACDCGRVFYPSGDTGCEQLVVRMRAALQIASTELAQYVDFQQKSGYDEYAAESQKKLNSINAVLLDVRQDETSATQNMHSDEWWQAELDRCVGVEQAKYRALFDAYVELQAGDPDVTAGVQSAEEPRETSRDDARDAARYRFLRHPGNAIVYAKDRSAWGRNASGHVRYDIAEQLDAAVDAARGAEEPASTQPPDSRGDAALWVLAWLTMKGGLGSEVHEVIEAVMEGRAEMRPNNKLHIEPRGAEKATAEPNESRYFTVSNPPK